WIRRRFWLWNWRWLVFGVNIDYVLNAFNYLSGGCSGEIPHPHEVVTFKGLFFRRVGFTNWYLILDRRLFSTRQWVAIFIDVFNRHAPAFNAWPIVLGCFSTRRSSGLWIRRRFWLWNWRWLVF